MRIPLSGRQDSSLKSCWLSGSVLAKLIVLFPPDELLMEFTTSPPVEVKGFSLCSYVEEIWHADPCNPRSRGGSL